MIFYAIYMDGKYLQGIEPNEHYSRTGIAPTMAHGIRLLSIRQYGVKA